MIRLEPRPLRLKDCLGVALRSFEVQVQTLLNARTSTGNFAEAMVATLEDLLPLVPPPDGYLGDLIAETGELRGRDGEFALVCNSIAYVGTLPDIIAAARRTVLASCEKFTAQGYGAEAARERQAMERGRPTLRVVV